MGWLFSCTKLWRIVILAAALADDFEAIDLRLVEVDFRGLFAYCFVPGKKCLWKTASEVGPVQVGGRLYSARLTVDPALVLLNHVNFIALGAEHFDSTAPELVAETDRQALLVVAEGPRTLSIHSFQIFIDYLGQT